MKRLIVLISLVVLVVILASSSASAVCGTSLTYDIPDNKLKER